MSIFALSDFFYHCAFPVTFAPHSQWHHHELHRPQKLHHLRSGQVLVLGTHANQLKVSFLNFERPMGIAASGQTIAIGSGSAVHFLTARHAAATTVPPAGSFDSCFVPHTARHTGRIMGHDPGWGREGLWIVNTLFSCLCTLDEHHSFVPRWTPEFISQLAEEDRCHLNGLAMADLISGKSGLCPSLQQCCRCG